ncbi:hypothetical protein LguiB_002389 [Lonicera macranthoides]
MRDYLSRNTKGLFVGLITPPPTLYPQQQHSPSTTTSSNIVPASSRLAWVATNDISTDFTSLCNNLKVA